MERQENTQTEQDRNKPTQGQRRQLKQEHACDGKQNEGVVRKKITFTFKESVSSTSRPVSVFTGSI